MHFLQTPGTRRQKLQQARGSLVSQNQYNKKISVPLHGISAISKDVEEGDFRIVNPIIFFLLFKNFRAFKVFLRSARTGEV
ncbi:MAG: hypothetical protein ACR2MD_05565 [Aridibacter sp.]